MDNWSGSLGELKIVISHNLLNFHCLKTLDEFYMNSNISQILLEILQVYTKYFVLTWNTDDISTLFLLTLFLSKNCFSSFIVILHEEELTYE